MRRSNFPEGTGPMDMKSCMNAKGMYNMKDGGKVSPRKKMAMGEKVKVASPKMYKDGGMAKKGKKGC